MKRRPKADGKREKHWAKVAAFYESDASLPALRASEVVGPVERRELLGRGKTKLVSIRIPEEDLEALRRIAEANDRGYQSLVIQAIERYLNEYWTASRTASKPR